MKTHDENEQETYDVILIRSTFCLQRGKVMSFRGHFRRIVVLSNEECIMHASKVFVYIGLNSLRLTYMNIVNQLCRQEPLV